MGFGQGEPQFADLPQRALLPDLPEQAFERAGRIFPGSYAGAGMQQFELAPDIQPHMGEPPAGVHPARFEMIGGQARAAFVLPLQQPELAAQQFQLRLVERFRHPAQLHDARGIAEVFKGPLPATLRRFQLGQAEVGIHGHRIGAVQAKRQRLGIGLPRCELTTLPPENPGMLDQRPALHQAGGRAQFGHHPGQQALGAR
ncbi:hypothetical protein D9M68_768860 [compost metagenome]